MKIRKIILEDIQVLADLWLAMIRDTHPEYSTPNSSWWEDETRDLLEDDLYFGYVAEENGEIVGFTDGFVYQDAALGKMVAWSRHTYIKPSHRHGKAAQELYCAAYRDVKNKGAEMVMFSCVDNLVPYYERRGYSKNETVMVEVL